MKRICKLLALLVIAAMLIPLPYEIDDGGSHGWAAALYDVRMCHAIRCEAGEPGYMVGLQVYVLGAVVFDRTQFAAAPEEAGWGCP